MPAGGQPKPASGSGGSCDIHRRIAAMWALDLYDLGRSFSVAAAPRANGDEATSRPGRSGDLRFARAAVDRAFGSMPGRDRPGRGRLLALGQAQPPIGHPVPGCAALTVAGRARHSPAFLRVSFKFLDQVHGLPSNLRRALPNSETNHVGAPQFPRSRRNVEYLT
jgi:hypothetical protein